VTVSFEATMLDKGEENLQPPLLAEEKGKKGRDEEALPALPMDYEILALMLAGSARAVKKPFFENYSPREANLVDKMVKASSFVQRNAYVPFPHRQFSPLSWKVAGSVSTQEMDLVGRMVAGSKETASDDIARRMVAGSAMQNRSPPPGAAGEDLCSMS
jgi:hypothetical protein